MSKPINVGVGAKPAAAKGSAMFASLATEARQAYMDLVVAAGRGDFIDPDHAKQVAQLAGRSLDDLQLDVERSCERFDRHAAYHGRDWQSEIDAAKARRNAATVAHNAAKAKYDAAVAALKSAKDANEAASVRVNAIIQEQTRAGRELRDLMRSTGAESDPAAMRLHDQPSPLRYSLLDDPSVRIDVGAKTKPEDRPAAPIVEEADDYGDGPAVYMGDDFGLVSTARVVL